MLNSTLLATLRLLNDEERDLLDLLIVSPLFKLSNRRQDAIDLHKYLKSYAPAYDHHERLHRKVVAEKLFSQRANPENELRKAMSGLQQILKKLILLLSISNSTKTADADPQEDFLLSLKTEFAMMRFVGARQSALSDAQSPFLKKEAYTEWMEQIHNGIKNKLKLFHPPLQDDLQMEQFTTAQLRELLILNLLSDYELFDHYSHSSTPKHQTHQLVDTLESLESLFYHTKLDLMVNLLVLMKVSNPFEDDESISSIVQYNMEQMDASIAYLEHHLNDYPMLDLYRNAFIMLRQVGSESSIRAYRHLVTVLPDAKAFTTIESLKTIKVLLRIFCSLMFHQTQSLQYLQKKFELTREDIDEQLLLFDNAIPAVHFTSLIRDALRLGQQNYAWAEQFLKKFENGAHLMATETPREIYKVNKANLLFHQQRFKEASNELIAYDWYGRIDDVQVLLLAIRIDIKIQFELHRLDEDYGLKTMEAAEKRIRRIPGLDEGLKNMTLLFIKTTRQIFTVLRKYQLSKKDPEARQLRLEKLDKIKQLLQEQPVAEKEWLLEKLRLEEPGA